MNDQRDGRDAGGVLPALDWGAWCVHMGQVLLYIGMPAGGGRGMMGDRGAGVLWPRVRMRSMGGWCAGGLARG